MGCGRTTIISLSGCRYAKALGDGFSLINSFSFINQEHRDNYHAVLSYLSQDAYNKLSNMPFNDGMMSHLLAAGFIEDEEAQESYGALLEIMANNPPPPAPTLNELTVLSESEEKAPSSFDVDRTKKHYLPQFYLEGFSFDGRRLHVFDKEAPLKNAFRTTSIDKVEKSWRAYSNRSDYFITEQIEPGILNALRFIRENPTSDVNDYLSSGDGSDLLLRQWLARFIVDFRLRSRGFRENDETRKMYEIDREMVEAYMEGQRAYRGAWLRAYLSKMGISLEEYENVMKEILNPDDYHRWVATKLNPFVAGEQSVHFYDEYATANMRLYEAPPGRQFVCSDMPSTVLALGEEYPSFIFFDVSVDKHRVLCGALRDAQSLDIVQESYTDIDVDRANLLAFQHAHRFVYSPSMEELKSAYIAYANQMDEQDG